MRVTCGPLALFSIARRAPALCDISPRDGTAGVCGRPAGAIAMKASQRRRAPFHGPDAASAPEAAHRAGAPWPCAPQWPVVTEPGLA